MGHDPEEFRKIYLDHTEVTDSLEEGLLAVDPDGKITLINKAARELLEITEEEAEGKNIRGSKSQVNSEMAKMPWIF